MTLDDHVAPAFLHKWRVANEMKGISQALLGSKENSAAPKLLPLPPGPGKQRPSQFRLGQTAFIVGPSCVEIPKLEPQQGAIESHLGKFGLEPQTIVIGLDS